MPEKHAGIFLFGPRNGVLLLACFLYCTHLSVGLKTNPRRHERKGTLSLPTGSYPLGQAQTRRALCLLPQVDKAACLAHALLLQGVPMEAPVLHPLLRTLGASGAWDLAAQLCSAAAGTQVGALA